MDAIDISEEAIFWAKERAKEKNVLINFECKSVFDLQPREEYDLVYDSGCLHHLWPHRRVGYIKMIHDTLKIGGYFGLTCFAPEYTEIGEALEISDWDVYRERSMKGGQAYSKEKLLEILDEYFDLIKFRRMEECNESDKLFGVPFLWATLWRKK